VRRWVGRQVSWKLAGALHWHGIGARRRGLTDGLREEQS
jgi:hypothetical protein